MKRFQNEKNVELSRSWRIQRKNTSSQNDFKIPIKGREQQYWHCSAPDDTLVISVGRQSEVSADRHKNEGAAEEKGDDVGGQAVVDDHDAHGLDQPPAHVLDAVVLDRSCQVAGHETDDSSDEEVPADERQNGLVSGTVVDPSEKDRDGTARTQEGEDGPLRLL